MYGLREPKAGACDNLKEGTGRKVERGLEGEGDTCMPMANSC